MTDTLAYLRAARDDAAVPADPDEALRLTRERAELLAALYPTPGDLAVSQVDAGGVPADLLVPPGAREDRPVLYLHGGAYVAYSPRSHRELAARIGRAAGRAVLVPDYRLAPEHPFPAALDDALAAWGWLRERGPVAVAGDSAGGGLALALALRLRERGQPLPERLALLSPWVDLTLSATTDVEDVLLDAARLQVAAGSYAGGRDLTEPLLSPVQADLTGLPPMLVEVGAGEILLADSTRLVDAARAAGVRVELVVGDDLPHVFQVFATTPEAQASTERIGRFLAG